MSHAQPDAERIVAEAETYAAEAALTAEHGPLVDEVERRLRRSRAALYATGYAAQDAMCALYAAARAHAAVQAEAAHLLAQAMPQRYREGEAFELRGMPWNPPDPAEILRRTVGYVLIEAHGAPPPPPDGQVPPVVFDEGNGS